MQDISSLADIYRLRDELQSALIAFEYFPPEAASVWVRLAGDPHLQDLLGVGHHDPYEAHNFVEAVLDDERRAAVLDYLTPAWTLPQSASESARSKAALLSGCDRDAYEIELLSVPWMLTQNDPLNRMLDHEELTEAAQAVMANVVGRASFLDLEEQAVPFLGAVGTLAALTNSDPRTPLAYWVVPSDVSVRDRAETLQLHVFTTAREKGLTFNLHGYEDLVVALTYERMANRPPLLEALELAADGVLLALEMDEDDPSFESAMDDQYQRELTFESSHSRAKEYQALVSLVGDTLDPASELAELPDEVPAHVPDELRPRYERVIDAFQRAAADGSVRGHEALMSDAVVLHAAFDYYSRQIDLRTGRLTRADVGRPHPAGVLELPNTGRPASSSDELGL